MSSCLSQHKHGFRIFFRGCSYKVEARSVGIEGVAIWCVQVCCDLATISQLVTQISIQHTRSRVCLALSRVSWAHFCNIKNVEEQTSGIMSIDVFCCSGHPLLFTIFVSSEPRPLRISVFDVKAEIASRISSHLCWRRWTLEKANRKLGPFSKGSMDASSRARRFCCSN